MKTESNLSIIWKKLGTVLFWIAWPGLRIILGASKRTRILLVAEGQILVVKPWMGANKWALPGGGLHREEDRLLGVLRELKEETGIDINAQHTKLLFEDVYTQNGLRFAYYCFASKLLSPLPIKRSRLELSAAEWVGIGDLSEANAGQDVCRAIAAWYKG